MWCNSLKAIFRLQLKSLTENEEGRARSHLSQEITPCCTSIQLLWSKKSMQWGFQGIKLNIVVHCLMFLHKVHENPTGASSSDCLCCYSLWFIPFYCFLWRCLGGFFFCKSLGILMWIHEWLVIFHRVVAVIHVSRCSSDFYFLFQEEKIVLRSSYFENLWTRFGNEKYMWNNLRCKKLR